MRPAHRAPVARATPVALTAPVALATPVAWASPLAPVVDEHLVVDVDACRDASLLGCGDVLQGSRVCSVAGGLRRLARLLAAYPGCGLAAVPLAGGAGGWALASGFDRSVVLVPDDPHHGRAAAGAPQEPSLLPSCVHAWLVAGRTLREWPYARAATPA
ncbi:MULTISPECIES: hypothetical protein [unclassified Streptomyces]|uniref:hypothetical protein n=1 Tax=unclassified Streptomyces TaxID=2593676 RepID=UPI001F547990|nr:MULTISPECIES: hypothetical protein [unclassified Streptomyces]